MPISNCRFPIFQVGNRQPAIDLILVKEAALHLPFAQIELSLGAATQTFSEGTPVTGEGPAELSMPATKHSRHQIADSSR